MLGDVNRPKQEHNPRRQALASGLSYFRLSSSITTELLWIPFKYCFLWMNMYISILQWLLSHIQRLWDGKQFIKEYLQIPGKFLNC